MKVVNSRDVFNETSMPGIHKDTTVKYVELEIEEEPDAEKSLTSDTTDCICGEINVQEESGEESTSADQIVSESVPHRSTQNKQKPNRYM